MDDFWSVAAGDALQHRADMCPSFVNIGSESDFVHHPIDQAWNPHGFDVGTDAGLDGQLAMCGDSKVPFPTYLIPDNKPQTGPASGNVFQVLPPPSPSPSDSDNSLVDIRPQDDSGSQTGAIPDLEVDSSNNGHLDIGMIMFTNHNTMVNIIWMMTMS
jgi:hypothetical protein